MSTPTPYGVFYGHGAFPLGTAGALPNNELTLPDQYDSGFEHFMVGIRVSHAANCEPQSHTSASESHQLTAARDCSLRYAVFYCRRDCLLGPLNVPSDWSSPPP